MGFGATLGEAQTSKWKVQLWEGTGNAWSQQQALQVRLELHLLAQHFGTLQWPAGKSRHQSSHVCAGFFSAGAQVPQGGGDKGLGHQLEL